MNYKIVKRIIKPNNSEHYFTEIELFNNDCSVNLIVLSPVQPKDIADIVACAEKYGRKAALEVQSELYHDNLKSYINFLYENKIFIRYDKQTNEISVWKE